MWIYNGYNTRDNCLDVCLDFTFQEKMSNGPPPECRIADCLLCDEQMSGPFFQTVAARSRRRSGLLSRIARPCSAVLIVPLISPCEAANATSRLRGRALSKTEISATQHDFLRFNAEFGASRQLQSEGRAGKPNPVRPKAPKKWKAPQDSQAATAQHDFLPLSEGLDGSRQLQSGGQAGKPSPDRPTAPERWRTPQYNETCFTVQTNVGLRRYQATETNEDIFNFFPTEEDEFTKTFYDVCLAYDINDARSGYWANVQGR